MLGRGLGEQADLFARVSPELLAADLTLANLEGALAPDPTQPAELPGGPSYAAYRQLFSPTAAESLQAAGFDLLGLADNHALDAGQAGYTAGVKLLEQAGLDPLENGELAVYTLKGVKIALLAVNMVPIPFASGFIDGDGHLRFPEVLSRIETARSQADVVIVSVHWGLEGHRPRNSLQQRHLRTDHRGGSASGWGAALTWWICAAARQVPMMNPTW